MVMMGAMFETNIPIIGNYTNYNPERINIIEVRRLINGIKI